MEEKFGNTSNSSATSCQAVSDPNLTAYLIMGSVALVAVILFNGLIAIMLLRATSVAVQVRVLLTNLLVAILIVAVVWLCVFLHSVALALGYVSEPSLLLCRFGIFIFTLTAYARILGLTIFSTMVLQPVACGMAESGVKWLMFSVAPCWVVAFIYSFDVLIPEAYGVQYVECIACFAGRLEGAIQVIFSTKASYTIVILNILPLLLCICIPLGTLCYIKRHTIAEGDKHSFLAKFAAFLILGSFLSVLSQIVSAIVGIVSADIVGVYVAYSIANLSYIPTPVLIVVFLKPVRKQLRRLFCGKCRKDNEAIPMQQAETPPQQFEMQPL